MVSVFKKFAFLRRSRYIYSFIQTHPYRSFFAILLLLFGVIFIGDFITKPQIASDQKKEEIKTVQVYRIGSIPRMNVQGVVEKDGVIKIVAQSPGIVDSINVIEGQSVKKGTNLIQLSSTYDGSNANALQARLAEKQAQLTENTYESQKDVIKKQKELAEKSNTNSEELRKISESSLSETRSLLDLNSDIVNSIDQNLRDLENTNTNGSNDALILQTKQLKSQFLAALNGLRGQVRGLEYQVTKDNPPTALSNLQKDITLKQLEIQEKSLDIGREISRLQVSLAHVSESLMHPMSPFDGIIERIHVKKSQSVTPGTVLLTLSSSSAEATIVVSVPRNIAQSFIKTDRSFIQLADRRLEVFPTYITSNAVEGNLYLASFSLSADYADLLTDGEYVEISIPVGLASSNGVIPFIPIDSVFKTSEETYVFVVEANKAKSKNVELGNVFGDFVEVKKGLGQGDILILDRNVIEGEKVSLEN